MKKLMIVCAAFLAAFSLSVYAAGPKGTGNQMKNPPKHVILVGFDGLSSYSMNNGAEMPTFRKLMAEGSHTTQNRSVLPSSSAVNWASMYMGAGPELHGFTEWGSQKPELTSRELTAHGLFPDIFYQIRQVKPKAEIGHIYEWGGMLYLADTLSMNYVKQVDLSGEDVQNALSPAVDYIKNKKPDFCAVIFAQPDGAGHGHGWKTDEYFAMLRHLDKGLKQLVDAIDEAGMRDETIIILAADHGGLGTGHGGKTMDEMQTTIVFNGKGIKKGFQIPESTMVYDIAGTIGYIFGINQPQVWLARPIQSIFKAK